MNDLFTIRVRAAAVAGWWTVLVAVALVTLQWLGYRRIMATHPSWFLSMLGPDLGWADVQRLMLEAIIAFRIFVGVLLIVVIWLTLWARQLKKRTAV